MNRALLASALFAFLSACGGTSHKPCNAATCASGCCDANDQCQAGNTPLSCGKFGLTCNACSIGQSCSLGACTALGAGGGTAQGGGTGFGGGTTSGGGTGFGGGTSSGGGTGFGGGTSTGGGTATGGGGTSTLAGDTCANAERITLGQTLSGTLTGYTDNYTSSSCFNAFGADHVYTFTLSSSAAVRATVSSSSFSPAVSVRGPTSASFCGSAAEPACNDTLNPAVATTGTLAAGTYFVIVEATDGFTGIYSLNLTTFTPPSGDSCLNPIALNLAGGTATVTGTTTGAANDAPSTSCTATGGDIAYTFTLSSTMVLNATVTPSSSAYQPTILLDGPSTGCSNTSELTCASGSFAGSSAFLQPYQLSPGTYTLWVSSVSSSTTGSYSLNVTATAPGTGGGGGTSSGNGTCASPFALTVPTNTSISGSTATGGVSAGSSGCGGGLTEQIYVFSISGTHTVTATAVSQTSTFEPILSYRSVCGGTEITCSAGVGLGGTATLSTSLSTGTYYLWVDSYNNGTNSTGGAYSLSVSVQ